MKGGPMYTQNLVNPMQPAFLRGNPMQFNQSKDTFHDVFQRALNNKSNSRPPRVELTGILAPCSTTYKGQVYKFKLDVDSEEYLLRMTAPLARLAKEVEWHEVMVKGYLDFEGGILEVEKISLSRSSEPLEVSAKFEDPWLVIDEVQKTLAKRGTLEVASHCLAS
jgi:hypothetical protein